MSTVSDPAPALLAPPDDHGPLDYHARPGGYAPPNDRAQPVDLGRPTGADPLAARRGWVRPVQVTAVFLGWLGVMVAATALHPLAALRPYALFAHLVFLAASFGAVLAVELQGLALLLRMTTVGRVVHISAGLDPIIWLGLAGMCASGIVLGPHLDRPLTVVKLIAVLAVALNGLWARDMVQRLRALSAGPEARAVPRELLLRGLRVSVVSQVGWWSAVVIGFLTTNG